MARVFPFTLKAKHKTLHIKRAWAELENLKKKKKIYIRFDRSSLIFDRLSLIFDQSSLANLHNKSCSTLDSNFIQKHTLNSLNLD